MTERELEDLVKEQLQGLYTFERMELTARIVNGGKSLLRVSARQLRKGRQMPMHQGRHDDLRGHLSVGRHHGTSPTLGRIHLIRPDAQNPLVVEVNFREMVLTGNMTYNIPIQDNDIIYVPPTDTGGS